MASAPTALSERNFASLALVIVSFTVTSCKTPSTPPGNTSASVCGVVHDWIRTYLTNKQQFTSIAGTQSSVTCVSCGVPQGSVLGPLSFLIYINDIGNAVANDTIKLLADDTNLFIFSDNTVCLKTTGPLQLIWQFHQFTTFIKYFGTDWPYSILRWLQ